MDRDTMRRQMEYIRDELNRLDEERGALAAMLRGYEAWFRAKPENGRKPNANFRSVFQDGGEAKRLG